MERSAVLPIGHEQGSATFQNSLAKHGAKFAAANSGWWVVVVAAVGAALPHVRAQTRIGIAGPSDESLIN